MHALGCDADDALRRLRQESQRRHIKVTEVAAEVVARRSRPGPSSPGAPSPSRPGSLCHHAARPGRSC
jgi:hypothetical protein